MEGDGFELPVPGRETVKPPWETGLLSGKTEADLLGNRRFESSSLQQTVSLSPAAAFEGREPRFSAPVWAAGLATRVSRDAPGFPLRANRRQYLCRAIFQYRSADEVVHENAAPIPTKLGLLRGEPAWIFEFGSGLSKAEHDPMIVPGKRQT